MLRSTWNFFPRLFGRTTKPSVSSRGFHKDYDGAREEQTILLSDGRTLGFAEYGDLQGTPAFVFHGNPGARYDGFGLADIAKRLNIRIICPDRPGYGLSSFQHDRKLGDYPGDISQLAKHLGIARYHVIGQSGGGPYAVACAYGSPRDELLNAAVIAGIGPPAVLTVKNAGWYTVAMLALQTWTPSLVRVLTNWSLGSDERLEKQLNFAYKFLKEEDRATISSPEAQSNIIAILKEAYVQGPDGSIRDGQIYYGPWDFELKDVHGKVKLFYGAKDDRTPLIFGRYYREHLPNAELFEYEDSSHFTLEDHDEEILTEIVGTRSRKGLS